MDKVDIGRRSERSASQTVSTNTAAKSQLKHTVLLGTWREGGRGGREGAEAVDDEEGNR